MQLKEAQEREGERVQRAAQLLKDDLEDARSDLVVFAREQKVREFLQEGDSVRLRLRADWRAFLEVKRHYDQLRLLDASGRERVRVERAADGSARFVPELELQDKSDRPYFRDAAAARAGTVAVSVLDLNVEHGAVERPYKPTLRYSMALRDERGGLLGVVVLNLLARSTLERVRSLLRGAPGDYGMVNGAGYALVAPNGADEWAFMQPSGGNRTLARRDPALWQRLRGGAPGAEFSGGELVASARLCSAVRGCIAAGNGSIVPLDFDSPDQPWMIYTRTRLAALVAGGLLDWSTAPLLVALAVILLIGALAARAAWRLGRTVDELHQRGALIDAFVNNNSAFMFVKDTEGRFLFANKAYERFLLGEKSGSLIGRQHAELLPPDTARDVQRDEEEVLRTGEAVESRRQAGSGEATRHFQALKFPMRDESGRVSAVGTISSDVTERVRAEQARLESEKRFRAILDAAPDAVVISDAEGRIAMANPAVEHLFGYPLSALEGAPVVSLIALEQREALARRLDAVRDGPAGLRGDEAYPSLGLRKDGQAFPLEVNCSALDTAQGRWVISVARDVSERLKLEHQLLQSQKMEAIGQLTGGVAHDFNNLLGIVAGNLELLERSVSADEAALKRVHTAQRAAQRGAELTRRLLAFSRRQQLEPAALQVNDAIAGIVEMAARTLGPDIRIETKLDPALPPILVDAAGLETALLNLAINARDAMPKGGTLRLVTSAVDIDGRDAAVRSGELKEGRYANIRMADTGQGMPAEVLQHAFEPFFTTKERGKGTGLGLAMVYGFVKQSGGNVKIYSEPGHGTTVSILLPLAVAGAVPVEKPRPQPHHAAPGAVALAVDDELDLLEIAVTYLEEMGYRVLQAASAEQALAEAQRESRVDLLITDVMMPGGMNGVELAQRLRAARPGLKVVFSSGFPSRALAERSGTRVDGPLLSKPYVRSELAAILHRLMGEAAVA